MIGRCLAAIAAVMLAAVPACSVSDESERLGRVQLAATCGDGSCEFPENSNTCPEDCDPFCGNEVLEIGEQCDDGAMSDSAPDACRTNCRTPYCGDGVVDSGELCDDHSNEDLDACRPDCRANFCGDGVRNDSFGGETCDDASGTDCLDDCLQDLTTCGDGVLDPGEACDLAGVNSDAPNALCRTDCQVARCGDGIVDDGASPPEECDRSDGCGPDCTPL